MKMEIPNFKVSRWLFADTVEESEEYVFLGWDFEHKSKAGKLFQVMEIWGKQKADKDGKVFVGENLIAIWNISNLEQLKKEYGKDTSEWDNKKISFKISVNAAKQFVLTPVENVGN